jgi:polyhydroxybutyrate depolymerase
MGWVYRPSHPATADSSCRRRKQPFVTAITVKVATGCNDRASGFSGGILSAERSKGDPNAEIQSMTFLQMTRGNAGRNLKSAILAAFFASIIPFASLHAAEIKNEQLTVGGSERSYIISTPRVRGPQPTVLVLHGSLANGPMAMLGMGFQKLVDREELVAVYPSAVAGEWNDGHEMAASWSGVPPDDVAFLRTLVEHLVRTGVADPARVYVTGFSSGGMMAFRLMCEAPESFAAIAPIAATIPADLLPGCKPQRATPTLMINGTADPFVPFGGRPFPFFGGRLPSIDQTTKILRNLNGCAESARIDRLPHLDPDDGSNVVITSWINCTSAAPVILYRVEGGGHRVPSREGVPFADILLGALNHDFDSAEVIWSFFKDKKRSVPSYWTRSSLPVVRAD